jgi:hypothetical protein
MMPVSLEKNEKKNHEHAICKKKKKQKQTRQIANMLYGKSSNLINTHINANQYK